MKIKHISLRNFRNYKELELDFDEGLNVLQGYNASGKTNLIEAIYFAGLGKSPRTASEKELVSWGQDNAYIRLEIEKKYRTHILELQIDSRGRKKLIIDGIPSLKLGEIIGIVNVVFFSPDELKLIKDSPSERRRFMDISLSQQNKGYFYNLVKYNKILAQRNKLLKEEYNSSRIDDMLELWDRELCEYGARIVYQRRIFLEAMEKPAKVKHNIITENIEDLSLLYDGSLVTTSVDDLMLEMEEALIGCRAKDKKLQYTTVGPHRDDIKILLSGIDVRKYGSQGQQRSAALSIKLAEIDMFVANTDEAPILLLDDVLSELDNRRQKQLLEQVNLQQTILTCTEYKEEAPAKMFNVRAGTII